MFDFYPRSPRGERRARHATDRRAALFLSTLPARGATSRQHRPLRALWRHFYPRSPRGERQMETITNFTEDVFLSTLPARGATSFTRRRTVDCEFLSTLPARGATDGKKPIIHYKSISIHAPREGSDRAETTGFAIPLHISIHAPREGSDVHCLRKRPLSGLFLSTLPARGATKANSLNIPSYTFLSTLPARGATATRWTSAPCWTFLSTLPARGATFILFALALATLFLSTLPARGATGFKVRIGRARPGFLSTLPARGATCRCSL